MWLPILLPVWLAWLPYIVLATPAGLEPQIPSVKDFTQAADATPFTLTSSVQIVVDSTHKDEGSPSLHDFAQTFRSDLISITNFQGVPDVSVSDSPPSSSSIFLTLGALSDSHKLFSGTSSSEGYDFAITSQTYTINGVGAIGAWWGTRTLLQQVALILAKGGDGSSISIPAGAGSDTPGWEVRGVMLDTGRHWFTTDFLSELCTYFSFFKIQTFHIHASDNLWNPDFLYGDDWRKLYSSFRFQPSSGSPISGIIELANETWTKDQFQSMQSTCAAHGITVIPEIDTPGHSLVITKWKPELMVPKNPDELNLTYPDTVPTIKALWDEVLPWFTGAEVHIGADEYDAAFANDYIDFVNEMSGYIKEKSGKSMRVWGTNEPSETKSISTDVVVQHWDFPGDSVPVELMEKGYRVINSEQKFLYLDGKTSDNGQFPYELSQDLIWAGVGGKGWAPNIFSPTDSGNNTSIDNPRLLGSIMALWNDWGGNSSTPLEIYYQLARSVAVFSEKAWAGSEARSTALTRSEFDASYPLLNKAAPGQNLNRRFAVSSSTVLSYNGSVPPDTHTSIGSVGPPYTLTFSVKPSSTTQMSVALADGGSVMVPFAGGTLFSGQDTKLLVSGLTFVDVPTNRYYSLGSGYELPRDRYTTVDVHASTTETWAVIDGDGQKRSWTSDLDIWGEYMKVVNMSFAAPSWIIGADGYDGDIKDVTLTVD